MFRMALATVLAIAWNTKAFMTSRFTAIPGKRFIALTAVFLAFSFSIAGQFIKKALVEFFTAIISKVSFFASAFVIFVADIVFVGVEIFKVFFIFHCFFSSIRIFDRFDSQCLLFRAVIAFPSRETIATVLGVATAVARTSALHARVLHIFAFFAHESRFADTADR